MITRLRTIVATAIHAKADQIMDDLGEDLDILTEYEPHLVMGTFMASWMTLGYAVANVLYTVSEEIRP